ncbi:purine or other phosphorylase family 1 [Calderihabitans maritimus]|uniref:Purine or other phosphorylase family 1 n=1 Tax=Calderihabitans maritimus TaxID=1246530 RepID=A0A1Z5HT50_9FIRM|nr:purine or other phosphorylase family 1 [Calderihabitans maritimus]
MLYIVTAFYSEAKPLIRYFCLKKIPQFSKYEIYSSQDVALIISGTGVLAAAIATAHLLTLYQVKSTDAAFNIGICGATSTDHKHGTPVLCHKIIHHETKRTYYPDILIKHHLVEGTLETFSHPVYKNMVSTIEGNFVDMEGAGFYEAAASFLPPHNIYCVKIVSDFLEEKKLSQRMVSELIHQNIPVICELINNIKLLNMNFGDILTENDYDMLHQISQNLRLSVTMTHQLKQFAKQYKIRYQKSLACLRPFLNVTAKSKSEGKIYFEQIKRQLVHE